MGDVIKIESKKKRDMCQVPGCKRHAENTGIKTKKEPEGRTRRSQWVRDEYDVVEGFVCSVHHRLYLAKKNGLETVSQFQTMVMKNSATRRGFSSITEYKNSTHPYRKYRKDFCENIDGRLGYICTYTPPPQELIEEVIESGFYSNIEVDHIDGIPSNNDPKNLQSLCGCCHDFKTRLNGDTISPGRKSLGLTSNGTFRTT